MSATSFSRLPAPSLPSGMNTLSTIGYELATPATLVDALLAAGVEVLVDVRAVPNSRRPGFSKKALTAVCGEAGIDYLHLRGLGTPAEGRAAARAGRHAEMQEIFARQLETLEARDDLFVLTELIKAGRSACLLCLEASPEHCHRRLIARAVQTRMRLRVRDLEPAIAPPPRARSGKLLPTTRHKRLGQGHRG